jgi:hypothetical protein
MTQTATAEDLDTLAAHVASRINNRNRMIANKRLALS